MPCAVPAATTSFLDRVIDTFFTCIDRGIATRGELPGGFNVMPGAGHSSSATVERGWRRVAPHKVPRLRRCLRTIAVNEENAAGGGGHRANQRRSGRSAGSDCAMDEISVTLSPEGFVRFRWWLQLWALCKMNASIRGAEVELSG